MSEAQANPTLGFVFTDEILRDPYPTYRSFLEDGQIHRINYGGGRWAVFRHAICSSIIRDPRLSARRLGQSYLRFPRKGRQSLLSLLACWNYGCFSLMRPS